MPQVLFGACEKGDIDVLLLSRVRRYIRPDPVRRFQRGRLRCFFLLNREFSLGPKGLDFLGIKT